jgi:hypothetical protein
MLAGFKRLRYPFKMLAIRQADVHGINALIGQEVFIAGMHSLWLKSCRTLFISAGDGVQVCSA